MRCARRTKPQRPAPRRRACPPGALVRFPLGMLAQYIGRKNATLVEMGLIALGLLFGQLAYAFRIERQMPGLAADLRAAAQRHQAKAQGGD